jgi:hypothetical protein
MALNIAALTASVKKATIVSKKVKRDLGPNPFLDPKFPANLQASYDNAEGFAITVAGKYVDDVHSFGADKGKAYKKLTGDAADAIVLLRRAAETLKLGVAIPMPLKPGPKAGTLVVEFQAQKRKAAPKPKVVAPVVPETPVVPEAPVAPEAPAQG